MVCSVATSRTEQKIATQRYEQDQNLALDKQREDLLQIYLDRMSELLLDKQLRTSDTKDEVRYIARSRTLTVLSRLDANRKKSLLQFLHESDIINATTFSFVRLEDADLSNASLYGAIMAGANLAGTIMAGANLEFALNITLEQLEKAKSLKGATM